MEEAQFNPITRRFPFRGFNYPWPESIKWKVPDTLGERLRPRDPYYGLFPSLVTAVRRFPGLIYK